MFMTAKTAKRKGMDRRDFLRGAGVLAGSAGVLAATGQVAAENTATSCHTPNCDYDVVVIGGGFAGVTAARDSRENGYKTLLLEARNRLGGRTFSSEFEGHQIELGGTWIHWTQPFVWAEKERYDLPVVETPGAVPDRMIMRNRGKTINLTQEHVHSVVGAFQAFTADARELLPRPYDTRYRWGRVLEADKLSAKDRLDQMQGLTPLQRAVLDSLCAASAHSRVEDWSYAEVIRWTALAGYNDFQLYLDAVARFKLKDGTIALINAMLDDGRPEVRLSAVVQKVEDLGERVRLVLRGGEEIIAGSVICTVPMNVLPGIDFVPALPKQLREAAAEGHTGAGVKLYIKVRGRQGNIYAMGEEGHPVSTLFTYKEAQDHTLMVGFGIDSQAIDFYDEEEVQRVLRDYLPTAQVQGCVAYDWLLDPYSKGTYASYKPGWMEKYYDYFQQDSGRILFASGDHGDGWRGFIDGAISAGAKAAVRANTVLA